MYREDASRDGEQETALGRLAVWFVGGVGALFVLFVLTVVVFRLFAKFML